MQSVFITAGSTYDGAVGRCVGLHETAGEDTLVGSTGYFKVDIGHAISVVLAEVEHEAVNDHRTYGAVVAVNCWSVGWNLVICLMTSRSLKSVE